jgi:alpha-galactosidase
MKTHRTTATAFAISILAFSGILEPGAAAGASAQPVKIYVLSGQSNMTGRGDLGDLKKPATEQKATLVRYIMEPQNREKYQFLYEGPTKNNAGWTIRDDVFITTGERHGGLTTNYGGFRNRGFGPELPIGHLLGDYHEEPVLLVKVAFGGCSLSKDMRPPSSGGTTGEKYPQIVKAVKDAIGKLPEIVPGHSKEAGHEIVGFFWNQGESDMSPDAAAEYETNLVNLINDLRKDLDAPAMKSVIAITGFGGRNPEIGKAEIKAASEQVIAAQFAVSKRPEFKDAAVTIETRDFYRPQDPFGGNKQGIHWHANGESYWLVGEAMGHGMLGLLPAKPAKP